MTVIVSHVVVLDNGVKTFKQFINEATVNEMTGGVEYTTATYTFSLPLAEVKTFNTLLVKHSLPTLEDWLSQNLLLGPLAEMRTLSLKLALFTCKSDVDPSLAKKRIYEISKNILGESGKSFAESIMEFYLDRQVFSDGYNEARKWTVEEIISVFAEFRLSTEKVLDL